MNRAVAAAGTAFETTSRTDKDFRITVLRRLADIYESRMEEMAQAITLEMGATLKVVPALATGSTCVLKPSEFTALSRHPDVHMMSFTGSTRAGTAVSRDAAETVKRVTLELGANQLISYLPMWIITCVSPVRRFSVPCLLLSPSDCQRFSLRPGSLYSNR